MISQSNLFGYGAAGLALLGAVGTFINPGGILTLISGFICGMGAVFAILFFRYGYIFVPLLTKMSNVVVLTDTGYEIPPSQDVVVKKGKNGMYYASVFLGLKIYESASEKTMEENMAYNQYFERAISNLKYVTKISYLLYVEDITEKRKTIESKKAEAQLLLQRERDKPEPDPLKLDRYERMVAKWQHELDKLIKGVKPMGVVIYAMTTAVGVTKEAAISAAKNQAKEIKAVLTNALNVEIEELTGEYLLKAFEWEKMLPSSPEEVENEVV